MRGFDLAFVGNLHGFAGASLQPRSPAIFSHSFTGSPRDEKPQMERLIWRPTATVMGDSQKNQHCVKPVNLVDRFPIWEFYPGAVHHAERDGYLWTLSLDFPGDAKLNSSAATKILAGR